MKFYNIDNISINFISIIPEILKLTNHDDLIEKFNNNEFDINDFFKYINWGYTTMLVWDDESNKWIYMCVSIIRNEYIIYTSDGSKNKNVENKFFDKLKQLNYNIVPNTKPIKDIQKLSDILNETHETIILCENEYRI